MTVRPCPDTALILGIGGQDGALLARQLLAMGVRVHGGSRDVAGRAFPALARVGCLDQVTLHTIDPTNAAVVADALETIRPSWIFNLAAQSSVHRSFERPGETVDGIVRGAVTVLEAIQRTRLDCRFLNASSSECFGDTGDMPANEETTFRPCSPYGVAKAAAHWTVAHHRQTYGLFACSGILFNHESPLRPDHYVTAKVVRGAADIAAGLAETLCLGDIDIQRDWGWAPEYVAAMVAMMNADTPQDLVIATGRLVSLQTFVAMVFEAFGLDWRRHVIAGAYPRRPYDPKIIAANPAMAQVRLGWQAKVDVAGVAARLAAAEQRRRAGHDCWVDMA